VQFVSDAFAHLKAIGHTVGAQTLLDRAGVQADEGVMGLGAAFINAAERRFFQREPSVRQLA
jgi:catalase